MRAEREFKSNHYLGTTTVTELVLLPPAESVTFTMIV